MLKIEKLINTKKYVLNLYNKKNKSYSVIYKKLKLFVIVIEF
jgi:hypothetical protein